MGLYIREENGTIYKERGANAAQAARGLATYAPLRQLFPDVQRIEAIYAGENREGRVTLYVVDKKKVVHKRALEEQCTDSNIWEAAQVLLGNEESLPNFTEEEVEAPPRENTPVELERPALGAAALARPQTATVEVQTDPLPPEPESAPVEGPIAPPVPMDPAPPAEPLPHPLEPRIAELERGLRVEEEELTRARTAADTLRTEFREQGERDREWQANAMRVFGRQHNRLEKRKEEVQRLERRLGRMTRAIQMLGNGSAAGDRRIEALEREVAALRAAGEALAREARAILPAPPFDRAPPAAAPPDDRRVNELDRRLRTLEETLEALRRGLQRHIHEQEETNENLDARGGELQDALQELREELHRIPRDDERVLRMERSLEGLQTQLATIEEQGRDQVREVARLSGRLDERRGRDGAQEERAAALRESLVRLEREIEAIRAAHDQEQRQHRESAERLGRLSGVLDELQRRPAPAAPIEDRRIGEVSGAVAALGAALDEIRRNSREDRGAIGQLREQLGILRGILDEMRRQEGGRDEEQMGALEERLREAIAPVEERFLTTARRLQERMDQAQRGVAAAVVRQGRINRTLAQGERALIEQVIELRRRLDPPPRAEAGALVAPPARLNGGALVARAGSLAALGALLISLLIRRRRRQGLLRTE